MMFLDCPAYLDENGAKYSVVSFTAGPKPRDESQPQVTGTTENTSADVQGDT
jgi:hypothetical protein